MGCGTSGQEYDDKAFTVQQAYLVAKLTRPMPAEFENSFEEQIFMAINLLRFDPRKYIPIVKMVAKRNVPIMDPKDLNGLLAKLNTTKNLHQVRFEGKANQACR